ncbi:MAG: XTP/dITP diphosphatase [Clostridia bacterium]
MKLIIASNNAHKVVEIREILSQDFSEMVTLKEAGLDIDVVEDGKTFLENAVKKAETVLIASGFSAALADDSGLIVDAIGGAPGVYSARYAGEGHNDTDNNAKLMQDMSSVSDERRSCRFACAIALARLGRETVTAIGYCEGRLLREAHGNNGFGYDPYFYYEPFSKTFAELSPEQKNSISHRKRALEALKEKLEQEKI